MRVNIICDDHGWVYDKFIFEFEKYSKYEIVRNAKYDFNIIHFLPYYTYDKKNVSNKLSTCWLSHQETKNPLRAKFVEAAKGVTRGISHSKKYKMLLENIGVNNVDQIMPGVDLDRFIVIDDSRDLIDIPKLSVRFVGRMYSSSNRKNPNLLKRIAGLPFVNFESSDGNIKPVQMPAFYSSADLIVSPATVEGGPLAVQESLASGRPIICYEDVGVANEFDDGVIKVPFGDEDAFIGRIEKFWQKKQYKYYHQHATRLRMRSQVESFTWANFVAQHDAIWEGLCS